MLLLAFVGYCASYYSADSVRTIHDAKAVLLPETWNAIAPEPKERLMFLLCGLLAPLVVLFCASLVSRVRLAVLSRLSPWLMALTGITLIIVACVAMHGRDIYWRIGVSYWEVYYEGIAVVWMAPKYFLLALIALGFDCYVTNRVVPHWLRLWLPACLVGFAGVALSVAVVRMNMINYPPHPHHADAVLYSVAQVIGGTPMLVGGFRNTYGLYPHFLAPLLAWVPRSYYSFSVVMGILSAVSLAAVSIAVFTQVRAKALALLCACAMYAHYIHWHILCNDQYFQFVPLRTLFPALLLILCSALAWKPSVCIAALGAALSTVAVLWNPDSGIFCFLGWLCVLCYLWMDLCGWKRTALSLVRPLIVHVGTACVTLAVFMLAMRFRYGDYPNLAQLFSSMGAFSSMGLHLLPMPLLHPWMILAAAIILGLSIVLSPLVFGGGRAVRQGNVTLLFCLVISIGSLAYYQGRSHTLTFTNAMWMSYPLVTLLLDRLLRGWTWTRVAMIPLLVVIYAGGVALSRDGLFFTKTLCAGEPSGFENTTIPTAVQDNVDFIKSRVKGGERVVIMDEHKFQAYYFWVTGAKSAFNPGLADLVFAAEARALQKTCQDGRFKIFIAGQPSVLENIKWPHAPMCVSQQGLRFYPAGQKSDAAACGGSSTH